MKEIQINRIRKNAIKGFVALVDDEDFEWLDSFNWSLSKVTTEDRNYAQLGSKHNKIRMHRLIMDAKPRQMIDHIDGNGLNNQKSNLRFCTNAQNQMNKKSIGISKYLGVNLHRNKWLSKICHNKKYIYLGCFKTELEAAKAYNEAAIKYHGEFARLNIIPELDLYTDCNGMAYSDADPGL
jgi:predicted TIM-barrel fold metal-dependent hydrolase